MADYDEDSRNDPAYSDGRRRSILSKLQRFGLLGADGGTRTRTGFSPQDFKSCVSTGSTTSARMLQITDFAGRSHRSRGRVGRLHIRPIGATRWPAFRRVIPRCKVPICIGRSLTSSPRRRSSTHGWERPLPAGVDSRRRRDDAPVAPCGREPGIPITVPHSMLFQESRTCAFPPRA